MLVLARKIDQTIVFPDHGIEVRLLDCAGRTAKIGITADRSVAILRGELSNQSTLRPDTGSCPAVTNREAWLSQRLVACQQMLQLGMNAKAEEVIESILAEITSDLQLAARRPHAAATCDLGVHESPEGYQVGSAQRAYEIVLTNNSPADVEYCTSV